MSPGISVLMTTYNREKYVRQAIQSVLDSTFKDFELVVTDDGSTDDTVRIVKEMAKLDDRIKLHINPKNLGDYPNRNQAASNATGKYLKYVDADDLIYPWGLQILWDCMEQFPEARWGLCSLAQDRDQPFPFQLTSEEAYRYHYLGPGLFHKSPLSSIIRRDLFEEVGGFRPGRMVGDFEMWHRLALHSNVVLMNHGVAWYRSHENQESNVIEEYKQAYNAIREEYLNHPECPLNLEEINAIRVKRRRTKQKVALRNFAKRFIP